MAHQLYVYQSLIFSLLSDMVNTRGNANNQVSIIADEVIKSMSLQCMSSGSVDKYKLFLAFGQARLYLGFVQEF